MRYLLGIDVGTSGTKAVLFDESGRSVASHTEEYPLYQPHNGWAEQDPMDWWNAVVLCIRHIMKESAVDRDAVAGIGLSGQMHGLVMLDADGNVLRNSIIWCDQRTAGECEEMNRRVGERRVIELTANPPMTGFTASKILWVRNHEPDIYRRCAHILLPKDFIRYKLTGEFASDVSDASGMQLMDVANRCWSKEMLEKLEIDERLLGKLYESQDVTGSLLPSVAESLRLSPRTVVVGGAGDNAAAAVGTGVFAEGTAFTTIGTSAVIYAVSDSVSIDMKGRVHAFCASVPGKWAVMSCTQGAGLSRRWFRDTCCQGEGLQAKESGKGVYQLLDEMAQGIPVGSNGLIYLPYLMGERSPHPDPCCRGVFFGLSAIHGRAHLSRAVLEGVGYSQLECLDVFREMGISVSDMLLCGGGSKSGVWREILANLYGMTVSTLKTDEGGALGAAILAGVGAGVYPDIAEACGRILRKDEGIMPDQAAHDAYMPYYDLYKKLYRDLKDDFVALNSIV